jgi:hypothetical protein
LARVQLAHISFLRAARRVQERAARRPRSRAVTDFEGRPVRLVETFQAEADEVARTPSLGLMIEEAKEDGAAALPANNRSGLNQSKRAGTTRLFFASQRGSALKSWCT